MCFPHRSPSLLHAVTLNSLISTLPVTSCQSDVVCMCEADDWEAAVDEFFMWTCLQVWNPSVCPGAHRDEVLSVRRWFLNGEPDSNVHDRRLFNTEGEWPSVAAFTYSSPLPSFSSFFLFLSNLTSFPHPPPPLQSTTPPFSYKRTYSHRFCLWPC